jgi:hypothetical protein
MVRPREVSHLEGESLSTKVHAAPKGNRQVDLPERYCVHPGDLPMEWRARRSDSRPFQAMTS